MLLYVNGCSWSSSSSPTMTTKVYADYLAEKLNCQFINHSIPASSNSRIIRSSVRNLNSLKKTNNDIICVINVTQPFRSEIWLNDRQMSLVENKSHLTEFDQKILQKYQLVDDGKYKSFIFGDELLPLRNLKFFNDFEKHNLNFLDIEKAYYQLFCDLLLFISYCQNNHIKYLIFAGSQLIDFSLLDKNLSYIKDIYQDIINDPMIIDFEKTNFCLWTLTNGYNFFEKYVEDYTVAHPDEEAHKAWAEFLYTKLR